MGPGGEWKADGSALDRNPGRNKVQEREHHKATNIARGYKSCEGIKRGYWT